MADPDVVEALARAGLATSGRVRLFHATTAEHANAIKASSRLTGDDTGRAWLASSDEIAALHHGGGAASIPDAPARTVESLVEVEVDVDDLFYETTREGDNGPLELFYLLDGGSGCPVTVLAVRTWP
jgi:hypothetical protein